MAGRLVASRRLLRRWPHLPGFWPGVELTPLSGPPAGDQLLILPAGEAAPPGWGGRILHVDPGPFAPPSLGGRERPAILFAAEAADPVAAAAAGPAAGEVAVERLRYLLRAARTGVGPGWPDPGPAALGCAAGTAILVLDPCRADLAEAAHALYAQAATRGRPLVLRAPEAPPYAPPTLPQARAFRLSPWTLIDAAAEIHALPGATARLAALAGVPVFGPGMARADDLGQWASLAAAARCADPVTGRSIGIEEALAILAHWRRVATENAGIAVGVGMAFWKRRRMAAALASPAGAPAFLRRSADAVAEALRRGGAIAVWASRAPRDLMLRARAAGVPVVWVEDGFIRSAGLGAGFLPAASFTLDRRRPYYDPSGPSDLEILLATSSFPPALLARAAALRKALIARGITKYNLPGTVPPLPATPGRRRILVPGQVEDDLSVLHGGAGAVRSNLDLLRAVRAANPDAFIAFKPHPDIEAGYRRGAIPAAEARKLADIVLYRMPIGPLFAQFDEVHTITSLAGFEALLRGCRVTCWGQPFYAGWGLTEDRAPIPRRRRRLTLDELVAGALILYPRYVDPVTELPCTPETLLDRLDAPAARQAGLLAWLRRWQGRAMARLLPGRG